ncbi:hypothetical protein EYF80_008934 [Liparis tanakae]|uniref:Uncharacterized protein n=1 Tax=Liparis tanakae TaxID=230148 RepID=A0A4Z2ISE3_9TELE|nr:hypothetical protein EYF80_008934 [Liparis tanakae]
MNLEDIASDFPLGGTLMHCLATKSPLIEPHEAHHVALSAEVQIVPLGWYRTGVAANSLILPYQQLLCSNSTLFLLLC